MNKETITIDDSSKQKMYTLDTIETNYEYTIQLSDETYEDNSYNTEDEARQAFNSYKQIIEQYVSSIEFWYNLVTIENNTFSFIVQKKCTFKCNYGTEQQTLSLSFTIENVVSKIYKTEESKYKIRNSCCNELVYLRNGSLFYNNDKTCSIELDLTRDLILENSISSNIQVISANKIIINDNNIDIKIEDTFSKDIIEIKDTVSSTDYFNSISYIDITCENYYFTKFPEKIIVKNKDNDILYLEVIVKGITYFYNIDSSLSIKGDINNDNNQHLCYKNCNVQLYPNNSYNIINNYTENDSNIYLPENSFLHSDIINIFENINIEKTIVMGDHSVIIIENNYIYGIFKNIQKELVITINGNDKVQITNGLIVAKNEEGMYLIDSNNNYLTFNISQM